MTTDRLARNVSTPDRAVYVPRDVLARALTKARYEYVRTADRNGHDPGPNDECWAEFEALAEYLEDDQP